jgi:methionyl-tRNA formyltransferase
MLKKEDGLVNWGRDAKSIHNQVRGLVAWPGAYTFLDGLVLKIYRSRIGTGSGQPGLVLMADKKGLEVACLTGSLIIEEMQLAGKKRLDAASFLSGFAIPAGTLLGGAQDEGSAR